MPLIFDCELETEIKVLIAKMKPRRITPSPPAEAKRARLRKVTLVGY